MYLTRSFVRAFIGTHIVLASMIISSIALTALPLNTEQAKSWVKKAAKSLLPPEVPPTQGDKYCFVMPRKNHNSTNTGKPRFIWDGSVTKVQILQRGFLIWEKEIESEETRSVVFDRTFPLEKGRYEYRIIANDKPYELNFYINSISKNLDMSESVEIDNSVIDSLVLSGEYWDANQAAYSTNNSELINELNANWKERCKEENNG